MKDFLIDY